MYDLEGTDTGREWVEIYNGSSGAIDLSSWKLREADTNHGLTVLQGNPILATGAYAVIADTPAKFLADYPNFSGALFDSSFSLSNTGETLVLKDQDLIDVDSVTYSSEQGAAGDGNSLQKVNGSWGPGSPTPGAVNSATPLTTSPATSQTTTSTQSSSDSANTSPTAPSVEQQIFPDAGGDKSGVVGADILFEGSALGIQKKPLGNARYIWNFGDGGTAEGQRVLHRYRHPGEYNVMLTVAAGENSSSAKITATIVNNGITISSFIPGTQGFVELSNSTDMDIDISRWVVKDGEILFTLPAGTELPAHKTSRLSNDISGVSQGPLSLLYPNGTEAVHFEEKSNVLAIVDTTPVHELPAPPSKTTPTRASVTKTVEAKESSDQELVAAPTASEPFEQTQMAAVGDVPAPAGSSNWLWYMALGGLIAVGGAGMIFLRPQKSLADEYEIVEEEA